MWWKRKRSDRNNSTTDIVAQPTLRHADYEALAESGKLVQEETENLRNFVKEVTDRLSSEIERQRHKLTVIMDATLDPMISIDINGKFVSANNAAETLFDRSKEDLLQCNIVDYFGRCFLDNLIFDAKAFAAHVAACNSCDKGVYRSMYSTFVQNTNTFNTKKLINYKREDNRHFYLNVHYNILNVEADINEYVFLIIFEDVTEKIEADKRIESLLQFQLGLLSGIPNPVLYQDLEDFAGCNPAFEKLFGANHRTLSELPEEVVTKLTDAFNETRKKADYDVHLYYLSLQIDTTRKLDGVLYTRAVHIQGKISGVIGVFVDTTELLTVKRFQESIFGSVPTPLYYKDANLRFLAVNKSYADIFGLEPEEMLGLNREATLEKLHKLAQTDGKYQHFLDNDEKIIDTLNRYDDLIRYVDAGTQVFEIPLYNVALGEYRDYLFHRTALIDNGFAGVIGSLIDITSQKQMIRLLESHERQLHGIFDNLPDGIVYEAESGQLLKMNKAASQFYNDAPSYIKDFQAEMVKLRLLLSSGDRSYITARFTDNLGLTHYFDITKARILTEDGGRILTVFRDVSSIFQHIDQSLLLSCSLNFIEEPVMIVNDQGLIMFANSAFGRRFNIDSSALIDMHVSNYIANLPTLDQLDTSLDTTLTINTDRRYNVMSRVSKMGAVNKDYHVIVIDFLRDIS